MKGMLDLIVCVSVVQGTPQESVASPNSRLLSPLSFGPVVSQPTHHTPLEDSYGLQVC